MKRLLILCCACLLSLNGCMPKQKVIEDIQLVQAVGYDYVNDDVFRGVLGTQITLPGDENLPESEVFTATGKTARMIRKAIQSESSKTIVEGRVGLVLFNKELAEHGIYHFIDNLQRDPNIGRNLQLAIVEDTTEEILSSEYHLDITIFEYLTELIEEGTQEIFPRTNLHNLLYQFYGDGMDMFIPTMVKHKDRVALNGLALFNDDIYVHHLNLNEASIFKLIYENFRGGYYTIEIDSDTLISLENVDAQPSYTITKGADEIQVGIKVDMLGLISEKEQIDTADDENLREIVQTGEQHLEERISSLLETFQELEIDPLGIGDRARSKIRHLDMNEWEREYPKIPVKVKVNLELIGIGISD